MTTLQDFFKAAKLKHPVGFAPHIQLDREPWKSQVEGLNKLLMNERFGLFSQPATGKTMSAQAGCLYWISEGYRCICLMPPTLLHQFREEFFKVFQGADRYVRFHIFDQNPVKRRKLKEEWAKQKAWPEMLAMSYQMFAIEYENLIAAGYQILLCDEAQSLKSSTAALHGKVKEFVDQPGGSVIILMSGTPTHNELIDAYGLIDLINPAAYKSFKHFDDTHSIYRRIPLKIKKRSKKGFMIRSFKQRVGYTRTDVLRKNLYAKAVRVLKKDVFELQDPSIIEVPIQLDAKHLKLYKTLVKERILHKEEELIIALNAQALRQKALQIVTCPELFVDNIDFKNNIVEGVKTIIDGMGIEESKVVVFANYQNSVRAIAKYFDEYNPALMYGAADSEKGRQKFLTDDTCRMLIANPKSAGVGLNLQHLCHTIIFAEPTGVPGDFQQAMDRVVRHGQKNLVNVYILKALGTISPRATQEMLRKEGEAQKVHHDWYTFTQDFMAA